MGTNITITDGIVEGYCSVPEFAKLNHVQPVTVRQWIRRGKLDSVKIGDRNYIKKDAVPRCKH